MSKYKAANSSVRNGRLVTCDPGICFGTVSYGNLVPLREGAFAEM